MNAQGNWEICAACTIVPDSEPGISNLDVGFNFKSVSHDKKLF